jgi:hypothetical protein
VSRSTRWGDCVLAKSACTCPQQIDARHFDGVCGRADDRIVGSFCSGDRVVRATRLVHENTTLEVPSLASGGGSAIATVSEMWDSGTMVNANGKTFSLYQLPAQHPGTFSWIRGSPTESADTFSNGLKYAALCEAAGLHSIASGPPCEDPCHIIDDPNSYENGYCDGCCSLGCISLPEGVNGYGQSGIWISQQTGWLDVLTHGYNNDAGPAKGFVGCMPDACARNMDVPLRPVCGLEHG